MWRQVFVLWAVAWLGVMALGADWEVESQWSFSLEGVEGTPHSLSPDGGLLLTWSNEVGVCLYRTQDLSPLGCFKPLEGAESPLWLRLNSITWSPDGERVLFSVADGRLWQLEVGTGTLEWLPASTAAEYVAFSPDGEYLAVGGGGYIVVAPPGALAEAPVARYQGTLRGLVWRGGALFYGLVPPDGETFEIWQVHPAGVREPTRLWSYPYPELVLEALSPDGRYAYVGADLVDLESGELERLTGEHTLTGFSFSPDGSAWLYSYRTVRELAPWGVLAIRAVGASVADEEILLEEEREIHLLGWADEIAVLVLLGEEQQLLFLQLSVQG
ncbi:MAG TPA: WD40 repeat domain-containing protein [Candidatus Acetothermia bacterium]|nr:WD40 repeat domain-containing protein [Candidatus Acetothermia bacterium]